VCTETVQRDRYEAAFSFEGSHEHIHEIREHIRDDRDTRADEVFLRGVVLAAERCPEDDRPEEHARDRTDRADVKAEQKDRTRHAARVTACADANDLIEDEQKHDREEIGQMDDPQLLGAVGENAVENGGKIPCRREVHRETALTVASLSADRGDCVGKRIGEDGEEGKEAL